jgi:hypothetical protein
MKAKSAKPIFTKRRARIAAAIIAEVPLDHVYMAAAQAMLQLGLISDGRVDEEIVLKWIDMLDADQLLLLKKVAEEMELFTVQ